MIICSCNILTKARLVAAGRQVAADRPGEPVTAGRAFRELGVRPRCGVCLARVREILAEEGLPITCPEDIVGMAEGDPASMEGPETPETRQDDAPEPVVAISGLLKSPG